MFQNGSIKDNLNFKTVCGLKEPEKHARITYENGKGIYVDPWIQELFMEQEESFYSIRRALMEMVRGFSMSCHYWEIYKLMIILHNIKPVWVRIRDDYENVFKVT